MFSKKNTSEKIEKELASYTKPIILNYSAVLKKTELNFNDLLSILLCDDMNMLKDLATISRNLTVKRFGKTISFYVPLYLSNECDSLCVYCGYNKSRNIVRKTLSFDEIQKNYELLKGKGFDSILLLTGDSREYFSVQNLCKAVSIAKKYFSFVGIEVYPMTFDEYKMVVDAGCDGITIYQETYHRKTYEKMHLAGDKKNYIWRLDTPDRALKAGFRKIGVGTLLGLYDPIFEILSLFEHVTYLQKKYWRSDITISFPRIIPEQIINRVPYAVSDKMLLKIVCVLRIMFPEVGFILSTRESKEFRDNLIEFGITQMSAGSSTKPGGYLENDSDGQFVIQDERELSEMMHIIKSKGYDPVLTDWHNEFLGVRK